MRLVRISRGMLNAHITHPAREPMDIVEREKQFWEEHEEFDWMSDASKRDVLALLPPLTGDVLELCVGSGVLTGVVPRTYRSYIGLDLSATLLDALGRKTPDITRVQGNAEELCFRSGSFDTVLVFAGLHHLPHYQHSIAESCRVLRPGGRFVCLEPNTKAWYRVPIGLLRNWIGIYSEDEVSLDPNQVHQLVRRAGFLDARVHFLTPRLKPSFLGPVNRQLARLMYAAAALGRDSFTQSFFLITATKA